jgi:hypothetical protein
MRCLSNIRHVSVRIVRRKVGNPDPMYVLFNMTGYEMRSHQRVSYVPTVELKLTHLTSIN